MKILVVEDEPNNMKLMTILLKHYGHDSIEAFTGAEGIAKTFESKPDIILMDLKLPDMEGIEVTKIIRETNKYMPIIAVTSYSLDDVREKFHKTQFNGFIEKPINSLTIMEEIQKILSLNIDFGARTKEVHN